MFLEMLAFVWEKVVVKVFGHFEFRNSCCVYACMFFFLPKTLKMFSIFLSRGTPKRSDIDSSLDNEEDCVDLLLSPIMPPETKSKIQHASTQCSPCNTLRGGETEPEESICSSGFITRTPLKHEAKNAEQRSKSPNSSRPGPTVKKIKFYSDEHDTPPTWQIPTSKSNMADVRLW